MRLNRRGFLEAAGAATLALTLGNLGCRGAKSGGSPAPLRARRRVRPGAPYRTWEDLYRERWTWDRIAKGTHHVNCWYQRGCNWNVFVKDGIVFREEQVAAYPRTNPDVPDFNPRGCQKGACYSQRLYDPARVRYPLRRVGPRGSGRWERVSWQEALTDIADRMIDVLVSDGPGAIYWDMGTAATNGGHGVGLQRTNHLLDTIVLDMNAEIGDHHPGAAVTCGKISFANSADDCFYADLLLIWGGNPIYTQIPNAHFYTEARYRGVEVVTIAPDYSPSAIHSDLWVPVRMGTDAALGLALAHVIVEEGLHDENFIREQTDLPFLVRTDNGRFLRGGDLKAGGEDDVFYVWDRSSGRPREAPRRSLDLGEIDPALEGEFPVQTRDGRVTVTPVFALLRRRLAEYAPERAASITGTSPALIRALARKIGRAGAVTVLTQSNFSKYYHGLEMERAQFLVLALCGHFGKKGSGVHGFPWLAIESFEAAGVAPATSLRLGMIALGVKSAPELVRAKLGGRTTEMFLYDEARKMYRSGNFLPSVLFFHRFGGLAELTGSARRWDPYLRRDLDEYLRQALDNGWQVAPQTPPRIFFEVGGNVLRRVRGYDRLIDGMVRRLDLMVTLDWRMSNTARHSDYVLPAAAWYERDDITWATPLAPFAHATTAATQPLGESLPDWVFHCLLLKRLQERARERGQVTYRDRSGKERRLDRIYDDFTFGRRYTEEDPEAFLEALLDVNRNLGGVSWKQLKEQGAARFTDLGMSPVNIGTASDLKEGETITALTWHTRDKMPWPTLTRRMQFYIDHELYLELGEELPVHKENPPVGGDYPLQMTGGHTRWSIHTSWRDHPWMLRLQRGEPVMWMSREDAAARGIRDGAMVRAYNDIGEFRIRARVSAAVRPGQVIVYHAWEPFQFRGHRSHQVATATPINPIQLAGGYGHLQPMMIMNEPGLNDRGTRLEVEPVAG